MTELKEIPTDKLVEELISRKDTEKIVPRWYFVNSLINYEMLLVKRSAKNIVSKMPFNFKLADIIVRLARVLLEEC